MPFNVNYFTLTLSLIANASLVIKVVHKLLLLYKWFTCTYFSLNGSKQKLKKIINIIFVVYLILLRSTIIFVKLFDSIDSLDLIFCWSNVFFTNFFYKKIIIYTSMFKIGTKYKLQYIPKKIFFLTILFSLHTFFLSVFLQ